MWTNFFDDFITFCRSPEAVSTSKCVESLFCLLGWGYADSGERFDTCLILFDNTAKRKVELRGEIDSILADATLKQPHALKLRGRMQFADGQLFGRASRLRLREARASAFSDCGEPSIIVGASEIRRSVVPWTAQAVDAYLWGPVVHFHRCML